MGRPMEEIDALTAFDLLAQGVTQKEMASEFGISIPTLAKRVARIQEEQGILMQYRTLQALELTGLQSRILEAITPEKIAEAPLKDLVVAFKILKEKEHLIEGKPSEIKGLVAHLVELEKQQIALKKAPKEDVIDGTFEEVESEDLDEEDDSEDDLPNL